MYIWILLATIMVAMTFFNVSPRVDKEHALNEIRAATVTNRFKAEHEAMLKTMECEIMYGTNHGWDDLIQSQNCTPDKERASACGPVDVSFFNPLAVKKRNGAVATGIEKNGEQINMKLFAVSPGSQIWSEYPNKNNFMTHIPMGYEMDNAVFPSGMYHFVYCLTEYAENAKNEDEFIRCDLVQTSSSSSDDSENTETPEESEIPGLPGDPEPPEESGTTVNTNVKKSNVGGYGRYLVSFAQIPEKWLSKTEDDKGYRYPLPILTNMLAKDSGSETIYGWTKCSAAGACQLFGLNARSGHVKRADEGRRYETDDGGNVIFDYELGEDGKLQKKTPKTKNKTGVSVDIVSYGKERVVGEDGQVTTQKKRNLTQVFEYELLKSDALFWKNETFQSVCTNTPCIFAYEVFPGTDTAYHCYNLMHEKKRVNQWYRNRNQKESENNQP